MQKCLWQTSCGSLITGLTHFTTSFSNLLPHERGLFVLAPQRALHETWIPKAVMRIFWNFRIKRSLFIAPLIPVCYSKVSRKLLLLFFFTLKREKRKLCLVCANLLIWFCLAPWMWTSWFQISQPADWFYDNHPSFIPLSLSLSSSFSQLFGYIPLRL